MPVKTKRDRVPIIQLFLLQLDKNKKKTKNGDVRVWGDAHRDQKL